MKKFTLITSGLLLCATTALAYNNPQAGYSINNKTPNFIMESEKIYGYMNLDDKAFHSISYFTKEDMEKIVEEKFTTKAFDECYNKIAVLDKNKLNTDIIPFKVLELERYAKLNTTNKVLLDASIQKQLKEKLKPEIRVDKIGGKNTITLSMLAKQKEDIISTNLSFLSANDRIYILATGVTDKIIPNKEATDKMRKLGQEPQKEAPKFEILDKNSVDPTMLKALWDNHAKYVKLFKTSIPVKDAIHEISFKDAIAAKTVVLPKDWCYLQYNHSDKKNPGILSFAIPVSTLEDIGAKMVEKGLDQIKNGTKFTDEDTAVKFGDLMLGEVKSVLVTASSNVEQSFGKDNDLKAMLANPTAAKFQAELFLGEGLKRLKQFDNAKVKLNDYKLKTDFKVNCARVDVTADVTLLNKHNFINQTRLLGTPQKGSFVWVINKKGIEVDSKVQSIFDKWSF